MAGNHLTKLPSKTPPSDPLVDEAGNFLTDEEGTVTPPPPTDVFPLMLMMRLRLPQRAEIC
jgi:hypothetical protein